MFTAWPLLITASFDWDLNYRRLSPYRGKFVVDENLVIKCIMPQLYYIGKNNKVFNKVNFVKYVMVGFIHGLAIFLIN